MSSDSFWDWALVRFGLLFLAVTGASSLLLALLDICRNILILVLSHSIQALITPRTTPLGCVAILYGTVGVSERKHGSEHPPPPPKNTVKIVFLRYPQWVVSTPVFKIFIDRMWIKFNLSCNRCFKFSNEQPWCTVGSCD